MNVIESESRQSKYKAAKKMEKAKAIMKPKTKLNITQENGKKLRSSDKNTTGLSHFMELGPRTDLLCDSSIADPLGPDGFENFQWVEVKQELPDNIEVCKFTLAELPLKVDYVKSTDDVIKMYKIISDQGTDINIVPTQKLSPEVSFSNPDCQFSSTDSENSADLNLSACKDKEDETVEVKVFLEGDKNSKEKSPFDDGRNNEAKNIKEVQLLKGRKNRPQQCDICDKKLYSKGNLRLHKLKMHKLKVQFTCELCSRKFDYQRDVIKHRNSEHRGPDGRFGCEVCSKRILDYYSYLAHIRAHVERCVEMEGSDKRCSDCDKSFQDDESLRIHRTVAHVVDIRGRLKNQDKNFTCDTCGRRFAFSCLLRDHINTHTGARPYLCQKCGKAFCLKSTLKQHTKIHSDVRPYQCAECPQGFYSKSDFIKHRRKHTGERPYVCEVCKEGFSRNTHLVIHRRTHTGERPHICDICDRGFTKRGDVVRHRRVHTGELPYLCQVCGKAFRQSSQCANHIKSQHPDSPAIVARNPNPLMHVQVLC